MSAFISDKVTYVVPKDYSTPMTDVKDQVLGTARLKKVKYTKGVYRMEGIYGYEYFQLDRPLWVTMLQLREGGRWKTWMVDDPLHWLGVQEYASRLSAGGDTLVAGLGLGLVVHAMDGLGFGNITVVEKNNDVCELVGLTVPECNLLCWNWYDYVELYGRQFQNLFWDLAVGDPEETVGDFRKGAMFGQRYMPTAKRVYFGLKGGGLE